MTSAQTIAVPRSSARSAADHAFPAFGALPRRAGIGLKNEHAADLLRDRPPVGFLEIHAENYMGAGGPPHHLLKGLRETYPLSVHGVGLSIGGVEDLDERHLDRLAALIERYAPQSFSEHLAWSTHAGVYFNDLFPIAYDDAALKRVVRHVQRTQERLRRPMLLENPSTYVAYARSDWSETDFLTEIARQTGCGLLLDVNNVMVSCVNHGHDAYAYLDAFPMWAVGEIHLAGYVERQDSLGARLLIDAHGSAVADDVWALFQRATARLGPTPTLIEWDNDVPELQILLKEARAADTVLAATANAPTHTAEALA